MKSRTTLIAILAMLMANAVNAQTIGGDTPSTAPASNVASTQSQIQLAYININDVLPAMPEYTQMMDSLKKSETMFQTELQSMADEYTRKVTVFSEQRATLNESIRVRRLTEIESIKDRTEKFQQEAMQIQDDLQKSLFAPIKEKLMRAIQTVADENGFSGVLDANSLYSKNGLIDATPLVKRKLGIH